MCVAFLAVDVHPTYPLFLVHNRDEFYARASLKLDWWQPESEILGGRDLKAGGSWFAVNRRGLWAAVTNYRVKGQPRGEGSRGDLLQKYLNQAGSAADFSSWLEAKAAQFTGFNLLWGDGEESYYLSNRRAGGAQLLAPGIYGLSNGLLDDPWPKVEAGKKALAKLLKLPHPDPSAVYRMMKSDKKYRDRLPQTGFEADFEYALSPLFVHMDELGYGTQRTTLLRRDQNGRYTLSERSYHPGGGFDEDRHFAF